jgi:acylphosphatase
VIDFGRVQGAFFRGFVQTRARASGLTGYARNMFEGFVEVQVEGERKLLEELITHSKAGPPVLNVENFIIGWSEYTSDYNGFSVMH